MTYDYTTITTANDVVYNAAISEEIIGVAGAAIVAADKFARWLVPTPGPSTINVPTMGGITVDSLSEGTEQDANSVSTGVAAITTARYGCLLDLTDESKNTSVPTFGPKVLTETGLALARKLDEVILALASGFTGNAISLTGAAMTFAGFQQAIYLLEDDNSPTHIEQDAMLGLAPTKLDSFLAFLAPVQVLHLGQSMTTSAAAFFTDPKMTQIAVQDGKLPRGYKGSILGVPVFQSSQVETSGTDRVALVASPLAIGIGVRFLSMIERMRNIKARSDQVAETAEFGVIELVDNYGCKITSKTAA